MRENEIKPLCRDSESDGCPIEYEAKNLLINRMIRGYSNYKRLQLSKGAEFLQRQALDQSGILDFGFELVIGLDEIHGQFVAELTERSQQQASNKKSGGRTFNG